MATAPPSNPLVVNGGFELGVLAPWVESYPNVATIGNGSQAFAGDYYLNLESAPGNRANTVHQVLPELDTTATYNVTAQVWGPPVSTANSCAGRISIGNNVTAGLIASVDISYEQSRRWLPLQGTFQPKQSQLALYLQSQCTLSGASHTGILYFDEITLTEIPPVLY
ncbi:uncharacterized protein BJX67DRAFT_379607 [Aspergillus lucknowensis]|uniref:CBM-cenC domain-containing protein n=1 Tax=Aspergillus lucknowensis TaxID=176173 RepID=A0ABR4LXL4_9EURO